MVLALVIATAGVLTVGGAYAVVASVPPLSATAPVPLAAAPVAAVAAVASPTPATAPAPQAAPAVTGAVETAPIGGGVLPAKTPGWPRVVVLGDTFTTGADGVADDTWPELVCARLQCEYLSLFATPGAGFTHPGVDGLTLGDRVGEVVAAQPDLVIVAGGGWDVGAPNEVLSGAVNQLLYRLARRLPAARTVVFSPFWSSAPAPTDVAITRSIVYNAAAKHAMPFQDVTEIFDADHAGMMSLDGSAPTLAGQTYIADVVTPFVAATLGR